MTTPNLDAFRELIVNRRSVRAYKPDPLPQETLQAIFETAQSAPSNCNTQPWQVFLASGAARQRISAAMVAAVQAGEEPRMDFEYSLAFEGVYRDRQFGAGKELYRALNIGREDKAARQQAWLDNYRFFGAPHAAFIGMNRGFGLANAMDVGMYVQNLMLTINLAGAGCCPQATMAFYPDLVRREFGIDEQTMLLCGISFGYADETAAVNTVRTDRASIEHVVTMKN